LLKWLPKKTTKSLKVTKMIITQIFIEVDDFMKEYEAKMNSRMISDGKTRNRKCKLSLSEIMTIMIYFQMSSYRNFKDYYIKYLMEYYKDYFPDLVSYNRFVELIPRVLLPLSAYSKEYRLGMNTGISYIDSTPIKVCHNKRIYRNKVFEGLAQRGKSSMGWFYGFKLHLIINEFGEIVNFIFSKGNVDDRNESIISSLVKNVKGKLFGDRGYISKKIHSFLFQNGIELITKIKKNMKNSLLSVWDKELLNKRGLVETVNDQLKNIYQLEHTRHRSPINAMVNWICSIIAYSFRTKKPSIVPKNMGKIS
jgi:hypothetical protein